MAASQGNDAFRILIINPNTSTHMTEALKPILQRLNYADVQFDYFTAPNETFTLDGHVCEPIASINNGKESAQSALNCSSVLDMIAQYDAFLVACYSAHPLVGMIRQKIKALEGSPLSSRTKYVTGIFEGSITASLSLISGFDFVTSGSLQKQQISQSFGIVTTGSAWKDELNKGVTEMLVGAGLQSSRFAGTETTGLSAVELHTTAPDEVRQRIIAATQRLLLNAPSRVGAVCLGCAGMAGMEEAVREGCVQAYGPDEGSKVRIVDGVVAGAGNLVTACKAGF
jgi:Asp/Glu/hydantoin racemase